MNAPTTALKVPRPQSRSFLGDLKFRQKMLLLPAVAMCSYLALLAVTHSLGERNGLLLSRIESGYAPALENSRDQEELLLQIQRVLQDAVAAEDDDGFTRADALRDTFAGKLAAARTNPVIPPERVEASAQKFADYYQLARSTSFALVHKSAKADLNAQIGEMAARFKAVREELAHATQLEKNEMRDAFVAAQELQRRSTIIDAAVIAVCMTLILTLSFWIVRGLAGPLLELTAAATRIAVDGDLNHRLEIRSSDEVGMLASSFQAMVEKLRSIPTAISGSLGELNTAVGSLTELTRGQTASLQRQAAGLSEASATTQEIKQTSAVAASKAEQVLSVAVKAEQLGASGQVAIEASIGGASRALPPTTARGV
jgi:methyl-accepting chemotaxis protein